jgi:iron complex transport system substrate-binding protein
MRALSPEGVLSLTPSVVLAIEGPPDAIEVLTRASVPFAGAGRL